MSDLKFWNEFTKEHKYLFGILAAIFGISFVYLIGYWALGIHSLIEWESYFYSDTLQTTLQQINSYPFSLSVEAESILFTEFLGGADFVIQPIIGYLYLSLLVVALMVLFAISTYLSKFWYFTVMGLFIVLIIFLKLDILLLFNLFEGKILVILALIGYLSLSYYFYSFRTDIALHKRIMAFLGFSGILAVLIFFYAEVNHPFMYLVSYSFPVALILTLVVILMVAHEVLAAFMILLTNQKTNSTSNGRHFFLISIIYIVNVVFIFLKEIKVIDFSVIPVSAILLFVISYLLGIWGFKKRESQYEYLIPFKPLGSLFYIASGIIAFSTIGYLAGTSNDPGFEVVENAVIYSQIAFNVAFIFYIASNFLNPLLQGMQVHLIMYKPQTMPFFTFRFAGVIIFLAFVFADNWEISVKQGSSAYFNSLGDLYLYNNEEVPALGYYSKGKVYSGNNHRSNYALAKIAEKNLKADDAIAAYQRTQLFHPSEFSYINLSNIYFNQKYFFEALFQLKQGLVQYPKSGPMLNNIGLLYAQAGTYDSAIHYLNEARQYRVTETISTNNLLAVMSMAEVSSEIEDLELNLDKDYTIKTNNLARLNQIHQITPDPLTLMDTSMTQISHAYIYNYLINKLFDIDTSSFALAREMAAQNSFFSRRVDLALALNYYYKGKVGEAINILKNIRYGEPKWAGMVNDILGKWYLDQGDPLLAASYFSTAKQNYMPDAELYEAMALTKAYSPEAIVLWDTLSHRNNKKTSEIASKMKLILQTEDQKAVLAFEDAEKFQWIMFHKQIPNQELINSIQSDDYKAMALLFFANQFYENENFTEANEFLKRVETLKITQELTKKNLAMAKLKVNFYTAKEGEEIEIDPASLDYDLRSFVSLRAFISAGDSVSIDRLIGKPYQLNPFNEELIIEATAYFESVNQWMKAYETIQQAVIKNPNSIRLQKTYIRHCGKSGSSTFGYVALEDLLGKISEKDYTELYNEFEALLQNWETNGL